MNKNKKNYFITIVWLILIQQFVTTKVQADPEMVVIGFYINDIQAIDLRTHSYVVDLYVWFRWHSDAINPGESFEFMNTFDPEAHVGTMIYDKPVPQPDGSRYAILRHQGAFSSKFNVAKYPFDRQQLIVAVEDSELGSDDLIFTPDTIPVVLNDKITLPGYHVGDVRLEITAKPYPTNFGDLSEPEHTAYSRAKVVIQLERPVVSGIIKSFLPMLLIVISAALALLLDPVHVEARIGLTITALLALVALQFTATTTLPEVGYLLMIDQIYIASYLYILVVIGLVVRGTRIDEQGELQGGAGALKKLVISGRNNALVVSGIYVLVITGILIFNLR